MAGGPRGRFHPPAGRVHHLHLDYVKDLVARYKVPTWIVPNAIQKMFFDFPRQGVVPTVKPLLINVGVISERKRQQALLAVLESLRNEGLSFDTAFVGHSSPQLPYSVEFSRRLAAARAKYGGFEHIQRLDEVSFCQLYDRASAMIHFSNEESFGLTFAEAIARGLYLFASDVGAIRDIAKGVEGVEVIGMDNWTNLKEAVRQWLVGGQYRKPPRPVRPPNLLSDIIRCRLPAVTWKSTGKCSAAVHKSFETVRQRRPRTRAGAGLAMSGRGHKNRFKNFAVCCADTMGNSSPIHETCCAPTVGRSTAADIRTRRLPRMRGSETPWC